MAQALLEVENLSVSYGPISALSEVSIRVEEGGAVGIIGPNGAGKSTLLMTLAGVIKPDAGTVSFEGKGTIGLAPEAIVKRGLALVPEARHIFGMLTVAENLQLGATVRTDRDRVREDMEKVLELFPVLQSYWSSSAGTLSGGEQQQLAIGRALLSRPRLLMLDEPSLGLAPVVVDTVFDALAELRESGTTILLVEQNAARTLAFAEDVYLLKNGVVAMHKPSAELSVEKDLTALYLGADRSEGS